MAEGTDRSSAAAAIMPVVRVLAHKIFRRCRIVPLDDLIGAGNLAAVKAAQRWDGVSSRFKTFAQSAIHGAMVDTIRRGCGTEKLTRAGYRYSFREVLETDGREETPCLHTDMGIDCARAIAMLSGGRREAIELHFLAGLTMTETAHRMGVSESRVSQLCSTGLAQIREGMKPKPKAMAAGAGR